MKVLLERPARTRLSRRLPAALGTLAFLLLGWPAPQPAAGGGDAPAAPTPESTRGLVARWVEAQELISRERREWQQSKGMLQSRIEVLRQELAALDEKVSQAHEGGRDIQRSKADLTKESESLKTVAARLTEWVGDLESRVRTLHSRLPGPAQEKVKPLYERIPADPSRTRVSLAERCQNVVGILNEINKLNGEITLTTEVRTLSGGKPAEVQVVYVGLAQAYFVSAGGEAGVGAPTDNGWQWRAADDLAPSIAQVVEVLQNKATPHFVPLPVKVQ